ncbi:MAG: glycine--tRNA ligase subunit beta [Halieaceae bacterium]|nr:glycine--tRNA ligase subunit beta [Halieaceae bacterium]
MSKRPLLIEIGCEELPSSALRELGEGLLERVSTKLRDLRLDHDHGRCFATPRRIAVQFDGVDEEAPAERRETLGPPLAQARDDSGAWTRAALGFAAKQGIEADELQLIDSPKGQRVGVVRDVAGAQLREALPGLLAEAITELPIAKRMRWGRSRLEFARPIQWLLTLFGDESNFGTVLGLETGNRSRGHRFHAPAELVIADPASYVATLEKAYVIADFDRRREIIREQVIACAAELGARALIDEDLLEEVTSLVEWPVALAGSFDSEFLEVPAEALISSMQSHQKYFPVVDDSGQLKARFITVSNIASHRPESVIAGNERVIRPRLADAAFFYRQDLGTRLDARVADLDRVVFQARLGSIGDKSRRIAAVAAKLAALMNSDEALARRAGELCKADLVSEMVLEFGELQGIAGGYYARNDGEDPRVCSAISQHYWPLQAGGELPEDAVAVAVALADRLDTLVGIFGIGQKPSGSRDPFGLRRAAIAILRLLIEKELPLDLREILLMVSSEFAEGVIAGDAVETALDYLLDRLPALYEDAGLPIELFRAVRATGCTQPLDYVRRLEALRVFSQRPEAAALAAANKRVANILSRADLDDGSEVSDNLLQEPAEKALARSVATIAVDNKEDLHNARYADALGRLATLRGDVDRFFDEVMVNSDDPALRANRLALLARLRQEFSRIADISLMAA